MPLTRRDFLKWSGAAGVAGAAFSLGFDLRPVESHAAKLKIFRAKQTAQRSGAGIALLGGMINYIIGNQKYFEQYLAHYSSAGFMVGPKFDIKDGLFSGYDPKKRKYDKKAWAFAGDAKGVPKRDFTMQAPRRVLQLMKKHYARYTPETVSSITGTPVADLVGGRCTRRRMAEAKKKSGKAEILDANEVRVLYIVIDDYP